jgi:benzoylformate decarboxylase
VVHFDLNAYEIAKNHRVDLGVVCDPLCAIEALHDRLATRMDETAKAAAARRLAAMTKRKSESAAEQAAEDKERASGDHASMEAFAAELAARLPEDAIVFDEALTNSPALTRAIAPRLTGSYFCTRGGSLGIGVPGAIGAKLACPQRTVVGFSGDGGSMYTIQALYTAAKYGLDILFVICHNERYKLLDLNIQHYWQEHKLPAHDYPAPFDLSDPCLEFCAMAEGMGVPGTKVTLAEEIPAALEQALATRGPFLIDLFLHAANDDQQPGCKCGQ